MNVTRYVLIILGVFFSLTAFSADLDACLTTAGRAHRLERESSTSDCFSSMPATTSKESCYASLQKFKFLISSSRLYNQSLNSCFYDSAAHKTIGDCLRDTKRFSSASDHDEGVFFCYQQFQEKLSKNECIETAKKMIFPVKKDYLLNHCSEI